MTGGIKLTMACGCRTGPSDYIGWQAGTTTLCHSRPYHPIRDYEFGFNKPPPVLSAEQAQNGGGKILPGQAIRHCTWVLSRGGSHKEAKSIG
jgi:hypothetical protein